MTNEDTLLDFTYRAPKVKYKENAWCYVGNHISAGGNDLYTIGEVTKILSETECEIVWRTEKLKNNAKPLVAQIAGITEHINRRNVMSLGRLYVPYWERSLDWSLK